MFAIISFLLILLMSGISNCTVQENKNNIISTISLSKCPNQHYSSNDNIVSESAISLSKCPDEHYSSNDNIVSETAISLSKCPNEHYSSNDNIVSETGIILSKCPDVFYPNEHDSQIIPNRLLSQKEVNELNLLEKYHDLAEKYHGLLEKYYDLPNKSNDPKNRFNDYLLGLMLMFMFISISMIWLGDSMILLFRIVFSLIDI